MFDKVQSILKLNKLGNKDRSVDFLLKRKMFCGLCGHPLNGESGTSKSGKRKHYYKCSNRKKYKNCDLPIFPKDALEELILDTTYKVLNDTGNIEIIADALLERLNKNAADNCTLNVLKQERDAAQKAWNNIMKAVEDGIFTSGTKTRLEELERKLSELDCKIQVEKCKEQRILRREEITEYIKRAILSDPHIIIRNLIQKILVFPDRLEIYYNCIENTPITNDPDDADHRDFLFEENTNGIRVYIILNCIMAIISL